MITLNLAQIVGCVFAVNTALSAIRKVVAYYDGVAEGQDTPPSFKALTILNKACYLTGAVLDVVQGNVKH